MNIELPSGQSDRVNLDTPFFEEVFPFTLFLQEIQVVGNQGLQLPSTLGKRSGVSARSQFLTGSDPLATFALEH